MPCKGGSLPPLRDGMGMGHKQKSMLLGTSSHQQIPRSPRSGQHRQGMWAAPSKVHPPLPPPGRVGLQHPRNSNHSTGERCSCRHSRGGKESRKRGTQEYLTFNIQPLPPQRWTGPDKDDQFWQKDPQGLPLLCASSRWERHH